MAEEVQNEDVSTVTKRLSEACNAENHLIVERNTPRKEMKAVRDQKYCYKQESTFNIT